MRLTSLVFACSCSSLALGWTTDAMAADVTAPPDPSSILGGDIVEPCGFPTAVSIGGSCTGTLVHPRVVVYAAHCGDQVPWIRLGDIIDDPDAIQVVPEMCQTHPVGTYGFGTDAAFCRLAEPIEGIPIAPPLMGCEAEAALQVGQPVTVAGYGQSDDEEEPYGIKRYLDTQITALSWDEVFIGGTDEGVCYGDSGGPTYAQAADGSWRSFGITSWGQPGCGFGGYLSTITHNIEWLETASEIDITPCHDGLGQWDPTPACTEFDLELHASGGSWGAGCEFGENSGWIDTCGDPFDPDLVDDIAPELTITQPPSSSRFELPEGAETYPVPVTIESVDPDGWGVGEIELVIALDGVEQARLPDAAKPFGFDLVFPMGAWTIWAEGSDRAGNAAQSVPVVFGVGVDPPPEPEPEPEDEDGTAGSSDDGMAMGTTGTEDGTDTDFGGAPLADDSACACRSGGSGGNGLGWLVLGVLALLRRRRGPLGAGLLALAACGDDLPELELASGSSGTPTTTSSTTDVTGSTSTDDGTADADSSSGEPFVGCGDGIVAGDEQCDDGNMVDGDGCSSVCESSGELLEDLDWPGDDVDSTGYAIAPLGDDRFVIAGRRSIADGGTAAVVLQLGPDLSVEWSTEIQGGSPDDFVLAYGIAVADDGAIWASGRSLRDDMGENVEEPWIARLDGKSGALLWSEVLTAPTDAIYRDVVALPGGDAVAVGWARADDESFRLLARRHAAEAGAEVWMHQAPEEEVESVALSATVAGDGQVVIGGWIRGFAEHRDLQLSRYEADGTPVDVTLFAEPLTSYFPRALAVDASGDVVVCGSVVRASADNAMLGRFTLGSPNPAVWLQRIEAIGQGPTGCQGVALDPAGRVAFAGVAFSPDSSFDPLVGRLDDDGELLWAGRIVPSDGFLTDFAEGVALYDDGDLAVVGQVESGINGESLWVGRVRG